MQKKLGVLVGVAVVSTILVFGCTNGKLGGSTEPSKGCSASQSGTLQVNATLEASGTSPTAGTQYRIVGTYSGAQGGGLRTIRFAKYDSGCNDWTSIMEIKGSESGSFRSKSSTAVLAGWEWWIYVEDISGQQYVVSGRI